MSQITPKNEAKETGGNLATVAVSVGAGGTGITPPIGGSGFLGWLSGIFKAISSFSLNSGNADATTLRAVISTDQPQLTNALKVDGSGVTQPVSGTVTANAGSGTFTVANGGTFAVQATQAGTWNITNVSGTVSLPTGASTELTLSALNGKVTACDTGAVVVSSGSIAVSNFPAGFLAAQSGSWTVAITGGVTANAGTNLNTSLLAVESGGNLATLAGAISSAKMQGNVAQINGVAPSMGNGVSGTGVQRVTIASDSTGTTVITQGTAANCKVQMATTTTATKGAVSFQASASNTAGSTTTGSSVDLTTALGCTITALVTNGTAPTLGCRFRVQVSNDNSTFFDWSSETMPTTASTTFYCQPVILPIDVMYARTVFDSNTTNAVTVQANGQKTTNTVSA